MNKTGWRKSKFRSLHWIDEKCKAIIHEGWTDGEFDYYKGQYNNWIAIDPMTGVSVNLKHWYCETKNALYKLLETDEFRNKFEEIKATENYNKMIARWYHALVDCGAIVENPIHN